MLSRETCYVYIYIYIHVMHRYIDTYYVYKYYPSGRIEWNPRGYTHEYFYCAETSETAWEASSQRGYIYIYIYI